MDVSHALNRLKEQGYKYTGKREDMLRLFAEDSRYMTAKDVLENMQDQYPSLSFDTIYRNLSLFADLELLETTELDGEKRFRFSCRTSEHHHHLICLDCGKTEHFHNCPMDEELFKRFPDFQVTGHKFEIYGMCQACRQ
ncbi:MULTISPECIES: Fur family transcriptional regulator [Shouchella]|uniref:Fur family transcriptional regulator n=2 Tax=Shouchella TaxID=2893057 RepID=A0ABY7W616_9BACI|nr:MULTISPECIES: Fur family transcriptional regulator [Shouchella]MED4127911.1 Fur family transcriptional regulator [Shouchella miscanthi]WDF03059.1 Fur family transcriptional regulator [Shouchella hunanensis]GAF24589.1 zinc uptake regulation protein ZUR [Bacillus sp. JCM 19047]